MFSGQYAYLYDLFHASKNYQGEVDSIIELIDLGNDENLRGFDLGCGTGSHALAFLKRGIRVDGFDRSEDMVFIARLKAPQLNFSNNIGDFSGPYDFTYSLFDVLSYQTTEAAATNLISQLYQKTKMGGVTLLDSWNSDGLKASPPIVNLRTFSTSTGDIIRKVVPRFSPQEHLYNLDIDLLVESTGELLMSATHSLRAWKPNEIVEIMKIIGFRNFEVYNPTSILETHQVHDWRFGIRAEK